MKLISLLCSNLMVAFIFLSTTWAQAQSNNAPSSKDIHDIKITGYLQTQFQKAQSPGISSFSGGDFSANSDSRFIIRRGRLKIDRVDPYTNVVFQLDATQNGVQLMDAFMQFHHPAMSGLELTAGLFNRPFGYSIVYSSGYRDFPERARVFQTIMPRERDIGAMVSYTPQKMSGAVSADFAVVNGSGLSAKDYDGKKDLIGSVNFALDSLANGKVDLGFGGSIYEGTVRSNTSTVYQSVRNGFNTNTSAANINAHLARRYLGANLQVQINNPFGSTSLKTEFVGGKQPGTSTSASITGPLASTSFASQPVGDLYLREFTGYYIWFTQQIAKTGLTALLAYDMYDPNKNVQGDFIGTPGSHTTAADVQFKTIGYGLTYAVNSRIKFTLYNEEVRNEITSLANFDTDIKDNVFTARLQYRW